MAFRWAMWLLLLAAWSMGYGEWLGVRLAGAALLWDSVYPIS